MTKDQYSEKHIRRMKLFERKHLRPVFDALYKQMVPVVGVLRSHGIEAAINSLDNFQINAAIAPPVRDIHADVGLYFANKTIHDINQSAKGNEPVEVKGIEWIESEPIWVNANDKFPELKAGFGFNEEFLREILNYFTRYLLNQAVLPITETTKQQILDILNEGLTQGWGAEKIADLLESPELLLWRARLIVRTEANKAMNYGQRLGEAKSQWETTKLWVDAKDARERLSHRVVGGTRLDFKDRFLVPVFKGTKPPIQIGVDLMSGPGDQHAHASNVCNCRCTLAFKAKRDENGRLIPKQSHTLAYAE